MVAVFDHADRASETVSAIIADHIVPATLEFMDNFTIRRSRSSAMSVFRSRRRRFC